MKCPSCNGTGTIITVGYDALNRIKAKNVECFVCRGTGAIEQTNFEVITKNEDTLAKWLSEKIHFCRFVSCDKCTAYVSDDECKDVTNAELWSAWLKQTCKE